MIKKEFLIIVLAVVLIGISNNITLNVNADQWEEPKLTESAEVWIPEEEFVGYFDSQGVYTVVGAIKNSQDFSVIPTVTITIQDNYKTISKSLEYITILPSNELPFKVKFPEISTQSPILNEPILTYIPAQREPLNVEVLYDETLVQHEDGHLTGRIINNGNATVYNIKVFAIVHGLEHETLDMGENIEYIEKLEPGQIYNFSMYPDPSVISKVFYYSCFAITDSFVKPLYSERNGNKFYFRYDGGTWYTDPSFNEKGTELSMWTLNSFPLTTYTNFEFPKFTDDEKLEVFVNGNLKNSIQSVDEMGNWHVAFNVEPREGGEVLIKGFSEDWDPGDKILLPDWIKVNAYWWSEGKINDDAFVRGIEFLIKEEIIKISDDSPVQAQTVIPNWIKTNAGWWSQDLISNNDFLSGIEYLIKKEIISV